MIFGCAEVMLEVLIPMLMSVIVDGGLYREEDFMLKWLFPAELVANRNRFVITVGIGMVCVAIVSMMCGLLAAKFSALASQGFAKNLRSSLLEKNPELLFCKHRPFFNLEPYNKGDNGRQHHENDNAPGFKDLDALADYDYYGNGNGVHNCAPSCSGFSFLHSASCGNSCGAHKNRPAAL